MTSFYEGSSVSALITGVVCEAAYDAYPGAEVTALGLEFGTVALPQVFQALRADHWLHLHPEAPAPLRAGIRHAMRAAFYVESDAWIGQVSAQARDAALAAVRGLACG